jgi:O-antigen ligase
MAGGAESLRYPPIGNGHVPPARLAGDLLIALGAILIAATLPLIGLRILSARPGLFPLLVLGMLLGLFLLRRPQWIIPSYIGLVWTSIEQGSLGGLPAIETIGLLLLVVATWEALRRLDYAREVLVVCAAIGLPLLISGLLSVDGMIFPGQQLKNLTFLFLTALVVRNVDHIDKTMSALALIGILLSLGALYSVFVTPTALFPLKSVGTPPFDTIEMRAAGTVGDPNFFALLLATLVPIGLFLVAKGGRSALLGATSVLCVIAGIFATGSRGGTIAAGAAIIVMAIVVPAPRLRAAAAVLVIGAIVSLPLFAAQTQGAEARSVGNRYTENEIAVAMFADHPITGVGPRQYMTLYRDYSRHIGESPLYLREPHSLPLEIAAEQGATGLIGWAVALVAAFGFALSRGIWRLIIGRTIVISIATFMIGSLFLHGINGTEIRLLYMLIGLLMALGCAMPRVLDRSPAPS